MRAIHWLRRVAAIMAALAILVEAPANARAERAPANPTSAATFADEIVYHIFVRSYRDSNGDGSGDIDGITASIPYLQSLGVTAVLLTPLYPSRVYHNYFATDFTGIDPEFGTMDNYRRMVSELRRHGIKIYLDMEFQYLAEGHPWWVAALKDRSSPFADYMLWRDRAKGIAEDGPFNLREIPHFGKDTHGVTTVALTAPSVRAYFDRYMLDWVDPNRDGRFDDGVDGFRLDHMMDDLDDRGLLTNLFTGFWKPMFDKLRAVNPRLTFIAEQADWKNYGEDYLKRADTTAIFAFPIHQALRQFDRAAIVETITRTATATPSGKHQLIFAENHDVSRIASDPLITPEKLRTAAALTFFLKGTPILYYGQELGMRGATDAGYETDENAIPFREAFKWSATDAAPGQALWYRRPGERFWDQRYARDHDGVSVEEQTSRADSLLNRYRKLARLRQAHAALRTGSQTILDNDQGLLVIERASGSERFVIVANLSATPATYVGTGAMLDMISGGGAQLRPWQTALFAVPLEQQEKPR
jgi:alpha-amylase